MSYTKFGEYMRVLRVRHHEVMGDVAEMLGVKLPFLSAVENGKKNIPTDWVEKIAAHYKLNDNETKDLISAMEQSRTQVKLDLKSAADYKRTAALQFARSFDSMDEETAHKIMELLERRDEE